MNRSFRPTCAAALAFAVALACSVVLAAGPDLKITAPEMACAGDLVEIAVETEAASVACLLLPIEQAKFLRTFEGGKAIVFASREPCTLTFVLTAVRNDEITQKLVQVQNTVPAPPVPPQPPTPVPPGPGPTPVPPDPAPIPVPSPGLRVLMIEETGTRHKLPLQQQACFTHPKIRGYLTTHCAKGRDGRTPEFRVYDQDVVLQSEAQHWHDMMRKPRPLLPWVVITNGSQGFSGPMPPDVDSFLELLKQFGGT